MVQLVRVHLRCRRPRFNSWVGKIPWRRVGYPLQYSWASLVAQLGKESTCNVGDLSSIPGLGRPPGEGKGYPLQYSELENPMDSTVHGVAKSRTRLSNISFAAAKDLELNWLEGHGAHGTKSPNSGCQGSRT